MATARANMVAARASRKPAVASAGDTGCAQSQQREDRGLPGAGGRAGARGRRCMPCGKRSKRTDIVKRDKHLVTHIVYSANHRSYTTTTSACLL